MQQKSKSIKIYVLILLGAVFFAYTQSLHFDFVNYDDYDLIYENSTYLSDPGNIFRSFASHAFVGKREEGVYYRPLLQISYIIDYRIWGLNPLGYHATNVLLHCAATIVLFFFLSSFLEKKFIALAGSLIFALHPIQVESVAWVAGRNDILLGLFILLMIYFYAAHYHYSHKKNLLLSLSVLSFGCALFTKESAAFFVLLLPAYEMTIAREKQKTTIDRQLLLKFIPFIIALFAYLLVRYSVFGEFVGSEKLYGKLPPSSRLFLIPAMISEHVFLLIFPVNLSVEHPLDKLIWFEQPWETISYIVTGMLAVALFLVFRIKRQISFGLLWLLIGFIPLLNIFPVAVPILEHRLYAPSAGFAMLIPVCIGLLNKEKYTIPGRIITILIIFAFTVGTYTRLPVWKNSESLWLDAIEKAPTAHRSYFNLAGFYYDRQQYERSLPLLNKYIELKPDDFTGYSKLRQIYYITGQYDQAVEVCRKMIKIDPKSQNRYLDLGLLFENLNMLDSAVTLYRKTLKENTGFFKIHDHLGTLFLKQNLPDSAEHHFNIAIEINGEYAASYFNLGMLYYSRGKITTAFSSFNEGMKHGKPPAGVQSILNKHQGNK